jgi:hypothetical protein
MVDDQESTKIKELFSKIGAALYMNLGSRRFTTSADAMYGIDSIRNTVYMPEFESHGLTFITRPKLNLTTSSIRQDRILSLLDTLNPETLAFAIRASLDSKLLFNYKISSHTSQFFNAINPFIPIFTNRLVSLNGWPDPTIDIETSEGGFFSESITYPKGHDQLTRNYDLTATFSDIQGSVVMMLFLIWTRYIALVTRGVVTAHTEDIDDRRMGFTSSIYRFVMDPSNRYITKWAKATGCFPRSVPLGAYFNYDANSSNVDTAMNLAVPMTVAGKVEYMDPIIFREFNMLVKRRCSNIESFTKATDRERVILNFRCIPYINDKDGSNELQWRYDPADEVVGQILDLSNIEMPTNDELSTNNTTQFSNSIEYVDNVA